MSCLETLSPESQRAIVGRARSILRALRRRKLETNRDLAFSLAAAKMVVTMLEAQAKKNGVEQAALDMGDELAGDLDTVISMLGLAETKRSRH